MRVAGRGGLAGRHLPYSLTCHHSISGHAQTADIAHMQQGAALTCVGSMACRGNGSREPV
eukprot:1517427-Alexandrium_andersonii.AAC.1